MKTFIYYLNESPLEERTLNGVSYIVFVDGYIQIVNKEDTDKYNNFTTFKLSVLESFKIL